MMSEKQKELIIKLANEKYLERGQLFEIEARTGHDLSFKNLDNLTKFEASMLIDLLIKAPKKEWIEAREAKKQESFNKYEKLVEWAKEQGLKVRNRMKKITIINIIKEAGLEIPSELI